jgi:hypothetical protein
VSSVDYAAIVSDVLAIRSGILTQFASPVSILASQIGSGVRDFEVQLSAPCNALWLPRFVCPDGQTIKTNPAAMVLGVRINKPEAAMLLWGLGGDLVCTFTGPVDRIYVTLLSGSAADIMLLAASGVAIGFSSSALTDGTAPTVPSVDGYRIGSAASGGGRGSITSSGVRPNHVITTGLTR